MSILPEFQEFLSSRQLVKKNYIPLFACWASKFLSFSTENGDLIHNLQVQKFLDNLKFQNNCADWQIRQAHDAIWLYYNHYCVSETLDSSHDKTFLTQKPLDIQILTDKIRQIMSIRHYSYRTEHTYILWVSKFLKYISAISTNSRSAGSIESADVRNYLSYLALKKRVSASTQNQVLTNMLKFILLDIALLHTYWWGVSIYGRYKSYWGIKM